MDREIKTTRCNAAATSLPCVLLAIERGLSSLCLPDGPLGWAGSGKGDGGKRAFSFLKLHLSTIRHCNFQQLKLHFPPSYIFFPQALEYRDANISGTQAWKCWPSCCIGIAQTHNRKREPSLGV